MKRKYWLRAAAVIALIVAAGIAGVLGINAYVKGSTQERIVTCEQAAELEGVDCILVLGCKVLQGGTPSAMLRDRLEMGVELYEQKAAPKMLMSGDHGREDYNEVGTMKSYAIAANVPSQDVFMDHAGFSTYESLYRAKAVFGAKKIIIVTQQYHLYRALYIAGKLGLDAYGVAAEDHPYAGQTMREGREVLARVKDFGFSIFKPRPEHLGDAIPVSGNGDITNDQGIA